MPDSTPDAGTSKDGWLPDTIVGMLGNITYTARSYSESRREKTGEISHATWPAIIETAYSSGGRTA
jgi:hypothetical protein